MAASGETSPLSMETKWGDNAVHLKDFAAKHPLPNIIKVNKGQYRNIGVAKNVCSELYIHSIRTSKKVLAEGVKIKEGRRGIQIIDQKFSLPLSYQGWFELLSEDGKPIKAILSVQELVKVFPHRCLVRENIKGFLPTENGELTVDRARVVHTGEQLTLVGEMNGPFTTTKGIFKKKILKCVDMKEEPLFFLLEQKGLFSPIAGSGNISGVHNVKGLLEKFRMPIMVRLVHGIIPTRMDKNAFTGVFRLVSLYSDETAFVCPLKRDAKMVPISTREPLKVVAASNLDNLRDLEECKYFDQRCTKMIASYNNSIHIMVSMPDPKALEKGKRELLQLEKERMKHVQQGRAKNLPVTEEDILFEEVDDIYQYVRDGGPPPPPRPRPGDRQSNGAPGGWPLAKKQSKHHESKKKSKKSSAFSPKKSPPVQSAPPPAIDRSQDEDYWEEPIYDDIEKYQRRKSNENILSVDDKLPTEGPSDKDNAKGSFGAKLAKFTNLAKEKEEDPPKSPPKDIPKRVDAFGGADNRESENNSKGSNGEKYISSDSLNKLSDSPKEVKSTRDVAEYIKQLTIPVSSLRQMYKAKPDEEPDKSGSGSRPGSYGDVDRLGSSEEDIMDKSGSIGSPTEVPRVPPKKFDINPHDSVESIPSPASRSSAGSPTVEGSRPAEVRVIPNRNVVTVSTPVSAKQGHPLPNNAKVNIILPSNPQQNSIVQSQQNISTTPQMVYNRVSNQISISTPTRITHQPQQQRYIAVARVGPEGDNQASIENHNSENINGARKMQSLHL